MVDRKSEGIMVETIYRSLLAGANATQVQVDIEALAPDERAMLLCLLSGIRSELRANCVDRAVEVDRVLMSARACHGEN